MSQETSTADRIISLPDKFFAAADKKAVQLEEKLDKGMEKYLNKLERQEKKLKKKLWKKDSTLAKEVFGDVEARYDALRNTSGSVSKYASVYSGRIDSMSTALNFLQQNQLASGEETAKLLARYQGLQSRLNASDVVRQQLLKRRDMLKAQLGKVGMLKELRQFRKQVYYYQAQVQSFKNILDDPSRMEAVVLGLLRKVPEFRDFFARNSQLGSLFALPGSSGNNSNVSLAGLQTRSSVNQLLVDRFGSGPDVTQMMQQNMQSAQGQLNQLKNKVTSLGSGSHGNGDPDMPDFKPNNQKTKSFLDRLEYGANMQNQKARYFFPTTSDIGLSLGYKLNDKSVIGVGISYKLGWGRGWDHITITHQGIGLRSYMDWKIKGSFYISGGYEQNYQSMINSMEQLKDYSAWQSSGLIGLTKKYKVNKKLKGEMRLMWDFLSYRQVPRTQAVVFRIGYCLR